MTQLPFSLLSEEHYQAQMDQVLLWLERLRQATGHCERKPGLGIYWEYYAPDDGCERVVFISHGFTESTLEYSELIWYFLRAGYGVFICDHMGHGKSYRLLEESWLTHVTSFDEYIEDLNHLMEKVVLPRTEGKERFLFGHSMGGAIAMLYLERYPGRFARCVLCSPMVAPLAGNLPVPVGGALANFMCAIGQGERKIPIQKPFDGQDRWESNTGTTSRARYLWYLERQRQDRDRQNSSATYSWAREAVNVRHPILSQAGQVEIPVLLCQASMDTVVQLEPQDELVEQLPQGRKIVYPYAKHEIYRSANPTLETFLLDVLSFLDE